MKLAMKVWEHQVSGCINTDNPEEAAAIKSFNERFTELFWILPRENRYTFMKLLRDINNLAYIESVKSWRGGFKDGRETLYKQFIAGLDEAVKQKQAQA